METRIFFAILALTGIALISMHAAHIGALVSGSKIPGTAATCPRHGSIRCGEIHITRSWHGTMAEFTLDRLNG